MKLDFNNKTFFRLSILSLFGTIPFLHSCSEDETMKWVDLRYDAKDTYVVESKEAETVSFEVKSTKRWEVFGLSQSRNEESSDWYTITPSSGDAGEKYTVAINCKDNPSLDQRVDTINIKSDYWTGKTFTLIQKGIAYLNFEGLDPIEKKGGEEYFKIKSNQTWTAEVTEGDEWLKIKSSDKGGENYKETNIDMIIEASPNSGEQRTGIVTLYDRNGEITQKIECLQKGVILNVQAPEEGTFFKIDSKAYDFTINVESNAEWTVVKQNETEATWFDFVGETEFTNNGIITIHVDESTGSNVREGIIVLSSKSDEGVTPVTKTVRFKQANPLITEVKNGKVLNNGETASPGFDYVEGRFNFYIEKFTGNINLFLIWPGTDPYSEMRYHIIDNKTQLSSTPWNSDVFNENSKHDVNPNQENIFSFIVKKTVDKDGKAWIYTEWLLNDKTLGSCISDGKNDKQGTTDTWKLPFEQIANGGTTTFSLKANGGQVKYIKAEYVKPIIWGE